MLPITNIKNIFFIGIGGIGMSALARYFLHKGAKVAGYDRTPTTLTAQLCSEGAQIHYEDNVALLAKEADLVVYTPAIPQTHSQLNWYLQNGYTVMKRSEVLQLITAQSFTIAVAGSHGKTTVTSMIAHLLHQSGFGCSAFVGGIMSNYNSNFIAANNNVVVVEADEFDRSFHRLNPDIAVITAVDSDHLEIYGTQQGVEAAFITFAQQVKPGGMVLIALNAPIVPQLEAENLLTYHLFYSTADAYTYNLNKTDTGFNYNILCNGQRLGNFQLNIEGRYNVENSIAAITVAHLLQIEPRKIADALSTFSGIKRRFEYVLRTDKLVLIDDYAHHPNEISALLQSVKQLYPDRKVTVIFQPHLYTRTRDLALEFALSFRNTADEVILLDIYPAREEPLPGVTSELIFSKIPNKGKYLYHFHDLLTQLQNHELEVVVTVGAGNIDTLVPQIKELMMKQLQIL